MEVVANLVFLTTRRTLLERLRCIHKKPVKLYIFSITEDENGGETCSLGFGGFVLNNVQEYWLPSK